MGRPKKGGEAPKEEFQDTEVSKEFTGLEPLEDEKETVGEKAPEKVATAKVSEAQIQEEIAGSVKLKDGKRFLVYKDGQEVWWNKAVIETMLKSFPNRISFPKGSPYVTQYKPKCSTCG